MFFDMTWNENQVKLDDWLNDYVARRYGVTRGATLEAWAILGKTAYKRGTGEVESSSIVAARPALMVKKSGPNAGFHIPYNPTELLKAWDLLLSENKRCGTSSGYRFDVVDIGRQVFSNLGQELHRDVRAAYKSGDKKAFDAASERFLDLIRDIDKLCETRSEYRFGDWLAAARKWGTTDEEADLYDKNASMLVTSWGPEGTPDIFDYSWREWSGLIREYYLPRWQKFHAFLREKLEKGDTSYTENGLPQCYGRESWNANDFYRQLGQWEMTWITTPKTHWRKLKVGDGDELKVALDLRRKWSQVLAETYSPERRARLAAQEAQARTPINLGKIIWKWNSKEIATQWKDIVIPLTHDVLVDEGDYIVSFQYGDGVEALEIERVTLLQDGTEIARDAHRGWTGHENRANVYRLKLGAVAFGAKYELKARIKTAGNGTDSAGAVGMKKVP